MEKKLEKKIWQQFHILTKKWNLWVDQDIQFSNEVNEWLFKKKNKPRCWMNKDIMKLFKCNLNINILELFFFINLFLYSLKCLPVFRNVWNPLKKWYYGRVTFLFANVDVVSQTSGWPILVNYYAWTNEQISNLNTCLATKSSKVFFQDLYRKFSF